MLAFFIDIIIATRFALFTVFVVFISSRCRRCRSNFRLGTTRCVALGFRCCFGLFSAGLLCTFSIFFSLRFSFALRLFCHTTLLRCTTLFFYTVGEGRWRRNRLSNRFNFVSLWLRIGHNFFFWLWCSNWRGLGNRGRNSLLYRYWQFFLLLSY